MSCCGRKREVVYQEDKIECEKIVCAKVLDCNFKMVYPLIRLRRVMKIDSRTNGNYYEYYELNNSVPFDWQLYHIYEIKNQNC